MSDMEVSIAADEAPADDAAEPTTRRSRGPSGPRKSDWINTIKSSKKNPYTNKTMTITTNPEGGFTVNFGRDAADGADGAPVHYEHIIDVDNIIDNR